MHQWTIDQGLALLRDGARRESAPGGPLVEARAIEHRQRMAELDMPRTRVFAGVSEGNFGSLRLNLAGRYPQGAVAPEDVEALLAELEGRLAREPFVRRVLRGSELYPGPHAGIVPDVLIEVEPELQVVSTNRQATHTTYPRPVPEHARDGILVACGPSIAPSRERSRASIADVAPTVLYLLGEAVYAEMNGTVRTELTRSATPPEVVSEADDPTLRREGTASQPFSAEELRELEERLQGLGYGG